MKLPSDLPGDLGDAVDGAVSDRFWQYAAKAVAALLVGPLLVVLGWIADNITPINYDPSVVEVTLTSVITAVVVYFKRNAQRA